MKLNCSRFDFTSVGLQIIYLLTTCYHLLLFEGTMQIVKQNQNQNVKQKDSWRFTRMNDE